MPLSRDRIIHAAIELLDDEGVEGLNMRALGARLGVAPTAVYWHVKRKDDLIVLAADQVWNEIPLPDVAEVGWRPAVTELANGLYAMVTRHPWLATTMSTHLVYGPKKAMHDDHALGVFEAAGFTGAKADDAYATVMVYVLGRALTEAAEQARTRRVRRSADPDAEQRDLAKIIEIANGFPRLRARMESGETEPSAGLTYGLEVILDGLESRLPSKRRPSTGSGNVVG